jgi:hypothetical protein
MQSNIKTSPSKNFNRACKDNKYRPKRKRRGQKRKEENRNINLSSKKQSAIRSQIQRGNQAMGKSKT